MKNKFLPLLIGALGAISLTSCNNGANGVFPGGKFVDKEFEGAGETESEYFAINHVLLNLDVGASKTADLSSLPGSYSTKDIKFTSSDESVATISSKGVVKGVAKGVSDIVISKKDGTQLGKIRVIVSKKSSLSGCGTAINNIDSVYSDPSYFSPTKVLRYEYSYENYLKEGKIDHGMDSFEAMAFDSETGYFFVEGPTLYRKTENGAPEVADGKWVFYPISEGSYTRMIHITPKGKNFYDLNTAAYTSYDRATRDIINFFFVSGEQIFDNLLDDFEGKEDFETFTDKNPYNPITLYNVNNNSFYAELTEDGTNQVVSADDEINYMDIPAGTVYSYKYTHSGLNYLGRTLGQETRIDMNYNIDGVKWTRSFFRSQLFENDFEEIIYEDPIENGFTEVESMYDL